MLELSKEQLKYLRRLLIDEINVVAGWLKVSEDEEVRARRYRHKRLLEEAYLKIEAEIPSAPES